MSDPHVVMTWRLFVCTSPTFFTLLSIPWKMLSGHFLCATKAFILPRKFWWDKLVWDLKWFWVVASLKKISGMLRPWKSVLKVNQVRIVEVLEDISCDILCHLRQLLVWLEIIFLQYIYLATWYQKLTKITRLKPTTLGSQDCSVISIKPWWD